MSIQVFISYKSEYRDFATKVRDEVRSWGHNTWFDMDDIPKGAYFRDAIEDGLDHSDVMLAVLTEEAQRSREVMAEVDYFLSQNKPLVPLKRGEFKLRYIFITIQWIDFTKDEVKAFTDLQKHLTHLADSPLSPPTTEPSPIEVTRDGTLVPGSLVAGGLIEDALPKPSAPVVQPAFSQMPPMQASPVRRGGGILSALAGILMLPFAGLAALFGWLRSSGRDEAELARANRAAMLAKVQEFWVVGVLENALKESGAFDLGLSAAPGAVLKHIDYGDYALPTSAKIGDVFNDLNRELLILGAPGAGKTIMLLQLARDLIQQAQADPNLAMPAVFNLSSWAAERKPLEDWLVDELRLKYQVPKKVAQAWVENEQLTLLLDGLDEVAEDYRNTCVDAINAYRQKYAKTDLVVCSRIADYEVLTSKLDLRGAITLQPLSMEQVNYYIDRPELSALREILKTDVTLQEMAGTPFLLNTMAYAYSGDSPISLKVPASDNPAKSRRMHLFDAYVDRRIESTTSEYIAQTRHYLAWLGRKMVEFRQSVFYIEDMQPSWLSAFQRRRYAIYFRLLFVFIFAFLLSGVSVLAFPSTGSSYYITIIMYLIGGWSFGWALSGSQWTRTWVSIVIPLIFAVGIFLSTFLEQGISSGVTHGVIIFILMYVTVFIVIYLLKHTGYNGESIVTIESVHFSMRSIKPTLVFWGVIGGAFLAVFHSASLWPIDMPSLILPLSATVIAAVIGALFASGLSTRDFIQTTRPNEGIHRSASNAIRMMLIMFAFFFVINIVSVWSVRSFLEGVNLGIANGMIMASLGFLFGGVTVLQHSILRFILKNNNLIPTNYARFLDYCASIQILRKVGGGYIFVHRYLLEYFAELEA